MAGYSVTVVRDQKDFFEDRDRFISKVVGLNGARFCQVVDRTLKAAGIRMKGDERTTWSHVPWVTPVLGSGCLAAGGSVGLTPGGVQGAVAARVLKIAEESGSQRPDELAAMASTFAGSLAQYRLIGEEATPSGRPEPVDETSTVEITDLAARAMLAAAQLSRLFHTAKARSLTPPTRSLVDVVHFDTDIDQEDGLYRACKSSFKLLRSEIKDVDDFDAQPSVRKAIVSLLEKIYDELGDDLVSLGDVSLLAEVAWFLTVHESGLYPGWNDLLFKLMLVDDKEDEASARPWFINLSRVGAKTRELFLPPSLRSWELRRASSGQTGVERRLDFYGAVATLLKSQAIGRRESASGRRAPVASAFVTSFDVELEMSLHNLLDADDRIYVVFPVQVLASRDGGRAKLCWVRARLDRPTDPRVSSEDTLEQFLTPTSWDIVHPRLEDDFDQVHLIHLAGCPLLTLPTIKDAPLFVREIAHRLSDSGMAFEPDSLVVSHAVVVDEYLALQQSEAELLWAVVNRDDPESSLALPDLFTGSDTAGADGAAMSNPRYWMALGVPLDDPAVRNRVITQLTIRRLLPKVGETVAALDSDSEHGGFGGMESAFNASPPPAGGMEEAFGSASGDTSSSSRSPRPGKVFISYSSADEALARRITSRLESAGLTCWFAPDAIAPGGSYDQEISAAIKSTDALVLVLSESANGSRHIPIEIEMFTNQDRSGALHVISIDKAMPGSTLDYHLAKVQRVEISSASPFDSSGGWHRLEDHLVETLIHAGAAQPQNGTTAEPSADSRGGLIGVVINRQVRRDDAGMLHWLGLDVVRDDAADFTSDILHLAAHLEGSAPHWQIPDSSPCEVGEV